MALAALYAFYGIAREVGVPPWGALLGTGLLAVNPIFFHLSYSFMTDVPFMSLLLLASYCYIRGLRPEGRRQKAEGRRQKAVGSRPELGEAQEPAEGRQLVSAF